MAGLASQAVQADLVRVLEPFRDVQVTERLLHGAEEGMWKGVERLEEGGAKGRGVKGRGGG